MPQGIQTLIALFILLPGFVSARIVRSLSPQAPQSELERVIEALIFSFFTYVIYIGVFGLGLPLEWQPKFQVHRGRIVFLAASACALGVFWGVVRSKDAALRLLRRWKLTDRTIRDSVWNDVFANLRGTAQVGLSDGRNVIGWVGRYSDSGGERSLFLQGASWVNEDGSVTAINGEGILLTDKAEIEYVMFLKDSMPLSSSADDERDNF